MSKKSFIRGTLLLIFTGFLSRLMGFFYRIFLSHTIGAHGIGVFQLVFPLQTLVMAICASGIQTAISRLCASEEALGHSEKARDFFVMGTFVSVASALVLCFLTYTYAPFLSESILKEPLTQPLIRMIAFCFPLDAVHVCINSYYYSRKKAGFPAAIQLLEQLARTGSCYLVYLIFLSEKRQVTAIIAAAGSLCGEIAACLLSVFVISIHFQKTHYTPFPLKKPVILLKRITEISFPLTLNKVLLTLLGSMEVILIPQRLMLSGINAKEALSIYGVFTGMALPLILFPATVTNSAAVMLLPSIAQLQTLGYQKRIRYVISQIFRYSLILGCFCSALFIFFGQFLGEFLFHSHTAGVYIRTMAFICPFLYLNTTLTSILNGLGKSAFCLIHSLISILIRVSFVLFAIPVMGIKGYLYGILCGELILTLLHSHRLLRSWR